ncbi:hypothetical protein IWX90DRAFT_176096 [Phyllosticta citrichinensis]|uniref:Uncharacterized protein n=1 Tax=Phyllosticta citrichinensis TaxID=1130410 RepID=A0ABR1XVI3_9PEZI
MMRARRHPPLLDRLARSSSASGLFSASATQVYDARGAACMTMTMGFVMDGSSGTPFAHLLPASGWLVGLPSAALLCRAALLSRKWYFRRLSARTQAARQNDPFCGHLSAWPQFRHLIPTHNPCVTVIPHPHRIQPPYIHPPHTFASRMSICRNSSTTVRYGRARKPAPCAHARALPHNRTT